MANWPTSVSTDAQLYVAVNSLETTLAGTINNSVTSISVASTTRFPTTGAIAIDDEVIFYTGISGPTFTGCTRGADGTTAASHNSGVPVAAAIVAQHHNALKDEIEAIEQWLNTYLGSSFLSPNTVPVTNGSGTIISSSVTNTELSYLSGVTSSIQTQLTNKQNHFIVNVKDFGAIGNGVADDTAAIQAAHDSIVASGISGMLVIPAGNYKCTSGLTIDVGFVSILGESAVLNFSTMTSGSAITFIGDSGNAYAGNPYFNADKSISNITIIGNGYTGSVKGFMFDTVGEPGPAHFKVYNCNITQFGTGISIERNAYILAFIGTEVWICGTCVNMPAATNSGERIVFSACAFYNSLTGFDIENPICDVYITGTSIDGMGVNYIYFTAGQLFINHCHFEGSFGPGQPDVRVLYIPSTSTYANNVHFESSHFIIKGARNHPVFDIQHTTSFSLVESYLICDTLSGVTIVSNTGVGGETNIRGTSFAAADANFTLGTNYWYDADNHGAVYTDKSINILSPGFLQLPDGSAAAPALNFGNSTTMGLFRAGANILGLATAGSERMRIDASGKIGINTTDTSANYPLRINSTGKLGLSIYSLSSGSAAYLNLENDSANLWDLANNCSSTAIPNILSFQYNDVDVARLNTVGALSLFATTNQLVLGALAGNKITLTAPAPSASLILTIPDPGTDASFILTQGSQTIVGATTFSAAVDITTISHTGGTAILGTNTNSYAAVGYIGEVITSAVNNIHPTAAGAWSDLTSIALTAGVWVISGQVVFEQSSNNDAVGPVMGISTTSGNFSTGLVLGDNYLATSSPTSASNTSATISGLVVRPTGNTTYYLKHAQSSYTGTAPFDQGRITAIRLI